MNCAVLLVDVGPLLSVDLMVLVLVLASVLWMDAVDEVDAVATVQGRLL